MPIQPSPRIEVESYAFNTQELARLAVYRAAIIARFYTDQCEPVSTRRELETTRLLASLSTAD